MKNTIIIFLTLTCYFLLSCGKNTTDFSDEFSVYVLQTLGMNKKQIATGEKQELKIKSYLVDSDIVLTGDKSLLTLQMKKIGLIKVMENTEVAMKAIKDSQNEINIYLNNGSIFSKLLKLDNKSYIINTANSVIAVRGTEFRVEYNKENRQTSISVKDGSVSVKSANNPDKEFIVTPGKTIMVYDDKIGEITDISKKEKALLDYLSVYNYITNLITLKEKDVIAINDKTKIDEDLQFNKYTFYKNLENIPPFINFAEKKVIEDLIDSYNGQPEILKQISEKFATYEKMKDLSPMQRLRTLGGSISKLKLKDGSTIIGKIILQDSMNVHIDTGTTTIKLPKNEIGMKEFIQ